MCGLKEIFEGAGNFFDEKVPANPAFPFGKKLNLIRFASLKPFQRLAGCGTEYHGFYQFDKYKFIVGLNPSVIALQCHLPFQGRL